MQEKLRKDIEAIIASDLYRKAAAFIEKDAAHTLDQQLELVKIPAFSRHEQAKSARFREMAEAEGYEMLTDEVHNTYTVIRGTDPDAPTVFISAHLDTVFPLDTPLEPRFEGTRIVCPGICDDTRGCAEILSLMRTFKRCGIHPKGTLIIGANVGEEGLGDLYGMRHFFSQHADSVDACFSLDGAGKGLIYGATGSIRYKVIFRGPGGHSYGDYGLVNPIHAMGRAISYISELRTPELPKTTFSVGVVSGGTSVNSIAYECSMLIDMRSDENYTLKEIHDKIVDAVNKAVRDENERWTEERLWNKNMTGRTYDINARLSVEFIEVGNRPGGSQSLCSPFMSTVSQVYEVLGREKKYIDHLSTDINIPISLGIPSCSISCGGTSANNHSLDEWYDPTDAHIGVQDTLLVLLTLLGVEGICEPMLEKRKGE